MKASLHPVYIAGSFAAAVIAAIGMLGQLPMFYGTVPGLIGGILLAIATIRFFRDKQDLVGFCANACGFIYYQAYQANPAMLPEFTAYMLPIPMQDRIAGIILANLTVAMLLVSYHIVSSVLGGPIDQFVPAPAAVARDRVDGAVAAGFAIVFGLVAVPNALFGKVIIGPIQTILYQRAASAETGGYEVFGGGVGGSFANATLWSTSLFLLWIYLLGSRFRRLMWLAGPLVLLWTAAVALTGSRTYLVTIALAVIVYFMASPTFGKRIFVHACWVVPLLFGAIQVSTLFRNEGLKAVDFSELTSRMFEIRGNEGASAEMDGVEYFRTELLARGTAPNPLTGFLNGLLFRPIDGALMVVPRSAFPWKPEDRSAMDYNLFYQNVRMGGDVEEATLGASAGLVGRELIRHGFLGPFTMLFWMGLVLALADKLFARDPSSDFHRIFAATLTAFFFAQSRDFMPVWFIPFLPAVAVLIWVANRGRHAVPRLTGPLTTAKPRHVGSS